MRRKRGMGRPLAYWLTICVILALVYAGSLSFGLAVIAAPLIMGITWQLAKKLSLPALVLTAGIIGGAMAAMLTPTPGKFFAAALLTGLLLPWFETHRPEEDDWFYLVPLGFALLLALLSGVDALGRDGAVWKEYRTTMQRAVVKAERLNEEGLGDRILRNEEMARWTQGQRMLPMRMAAVCLTGLALSLYVILSFFRRDTESMHAKPEGFVAFHTKEIYLWILLGGLVARIVWHYRTEAWVGQIGYGLLFLAGAGFFLQAIAVVAWHIRKFEVGFPVVLSSVAAIAAVVAAPILAAPIAMVGLADVWLDFRRLD